MATNKPTLPNAFVDFETQNLGNIPITPSGTFAFIGTFQDGTSVKDVIASIGNPNEAKAKLGKGELLDGILDYFDNGGRRVIAIPLDITTLSTISSVTATPVPGGAPGTGTITVAPVATKKIANEFDVLIEITKTGTLGAGKFKFSTDNGDNFSASILIPSSGTFVIPNTNIEITFVPAAGPTFFELGDKHDFTTTLPLASTGDIESAVDTFIASTNSFDAIVVAHEADAALMNSLGTKVNNAEGSPDFRYNYVIVRPALSTSATQAVTQASTIRGSVGDGRIQIITAESDNKRPQYGDNRDRNDIGVIAGRRSSLAVQEDLGRVSVGNLANINALRTGWTDTTIEDLDGLQTVTIRQFKGLAGFFPTNGPMSDPFNDAKKDAFRLVLDKAARIARVSGLSFVKVTVDPLNVSASTEPLKNTIQAAMDKIVANGEASQINVNIPDNQDVLTSEQIDVNIDVIPFGHASFIGITIGLINPFVVS